MDKDTRRKTLLTQRATISTESAQEAGRAAQQRLMDTPHWRNARRVLLYVPLRNELDTMQLIHEAWHTEKTVLLPRVDRLATGSMHIATCRSEKELISGPFGLREPNPALCPPVDTNDPAEAPDLAVIPGVAYDREGNRLGFGAGYYDRYLALPSMAGTTLLGFAYAFQIVDHLPADPWDRPVHGLCSEKELVWL